jgi:hypothetical protein
MKSKTKVEAPVAEPIDEVREKLRRKRDSAMGMPINWLILAVNQGGGYAPVARQLKVSQKTVRRWKTVGLDDVPFGKVVKLAQLARMPLGRTLDRCVGSDYRRAVVIAAKIDKQIDRHDAAVEKQRRKAS